MSGTAATTSHSDLRRTTGEKGDPNLRAHITQTLHRFIEVEEARAFYTESLPTHLALEERLPQIAPLVAASLDRTQRTSPLRAKRKSIGMTSITETVKSTLADLDAEYEIVACEPEFADTEVFCDRYGYELADSANTIVVAGKSTPKVYAACVVLADSKLDVNGTVRRRLGTRKASFASAEETRDLTGMQIGGVTPIALPEDLPLWIDSRVLSRRRVIVGGGDRTSKLVLAPEALAALFNAEVVDDLSRSA